MLFIKIKVMVVKLIILFVFWFKSYVLKFTSQLNRNLPSMTSFGILDFAVMFTTFFCGCCQGYIYIIIGLNHIQKIIQHKNKSNMIITLIDIKTSQ